MFVILFSCLCPSEPDMRQGSSAGNVRTQTPIREKGQKLTPNRFAGKSNFCACDTFHNQLHRWAADTIALSCSDYASHTTVSLCSVSACVHQSLCMCVLSTVKDPSPEELLRQLQEERTCKVCMDKLVSIVFIPCGHLVVCGDCAASLRHCPICRAVIRGSVRAFMSWGCSEKPLLYRCCMSGLEFSSVLIFLCTDKKK